MEKIVNAIKQLITPKEKDGTHLTLHVQINALLWFIAEELQNLHKKNEELIQIVKNAQENENNIARKMEAVKAGINDVITGESKKLKEYVNEKIQVDSFVVNYKWIVSTDGEINYDLDPIQPKLHAPYRIEVVAIRSSKTNDAVGAVQLPGIQNIEWEYIPTIYVKSRGWKAIYEYDFDVLVTKL